ncbi:hypothetical protein [Paenibacillus hexagrammi]|uniref:HTH LytTR-type domain-containing protein n=1 Tax=Paenibacillus hexagrammi TaxID=2908839 RepID=A0ABY3SFN0_9BACL|nr:hypothetical protein [Paenibacillus sp. YPD9-1]UJF31885.1 hypothetical protein L0M14_19270 [Paenibacillus sp. YPD9-1]
MNVALNVRNTYEDFVLEKDIMFFRVGEHGLVSFHGKNYNIKKRMSSEEVSGLTENPKFFKVNTDCYANIAKISGIQDGKVYFEMKSGETKYTAITKLRQFRLKELLQMTKEQAQ